jgi:hypothetical protein
MIKNHRTIFTVYIAGPYRSDSINGVRENIEAARRAAVELAKRGIHFRCPHTMTGFMDGVATDEYFLGLGLEMLRGCQAILLLPGWEKSHGTREEIRLAETLCVHRCENIEYVEQWKTEWEEERLLDGAEYREMPE